MSIYKYYIKYEKEKLLLSIESSFYIISKKSSLVSNLVSPGRIELPTYRLGGDCSILLSYEDTKNIITYILKFFPYYFYIIGPIEYYYNREEVVWRKYGKIIKEQYYYYWGL